MKKKSYRILQVALCFYFVIYIIAVLYNSEYWGNILSPIGTFAAFLILLYCAKSKAKRQYFFLLSLACLSWSITDVLWAIYYFALAQNPEELDLFTYLYLLPNLFMVLSIGKTMFDQRKNMVAMQVIIDIIAFSYSILTFIWIIAFNQEFKNLLNIDLTTNTVFLYMLTDFFIAAAPIMWLINIPKNRKRFVNMIILCLGAILFALIDMYYSYLYFENLYIPNNIVDGIYMASFMLLAWGGLREIYHPSRFFVLRIQEFYNIGSGIKGLLMLLPLFILLLMNKISMSIILIFLTIAAIYEVISHLITAERKKEALLHQEKTINTFLEERMTEQTEKLRKSNQELELLTKKDYVADIFNKSYLLILLGKIIKNIKFQESVLIYLVDIVNIDEINGVIGPETEERVFESAANMLRECISSDTVLARLDREKFVLISSGNINKNEAEQTVKTIIQYCSAPLQIDKYELYLILNIGMAIYPGDGLECDELIKKAELALLQAKKIGTNQYFFFEDFLLENEERKAQLRMLLEKADFEKEFQLYYQPQYDISGEVLIGAEALLRWNSPEIGMIAPGEFIPIAEDTGIIIKLGEWSIKKAINQIITWNENYDSKMRISINLSLAQFKDTAFMNKLITFLRDNNVCPEWVDIEIAEGIAMKGNKEFADIFNRISEMGFSISIDNFGANYSSLNYLENFSVNRIKIAQQLVDDVDKDNSKAKIVKAVVSMAKSLGLIVTAVGVECIEQLEVLKDFECDEIQGRLFGYPLPVSEFEKIYF